MKWSIYNVLGVMICNRKMPVVHAGIFPKHNFSPQCYIYGIECCMGIDFFELMN